MPVKDINTVCTWEMQRNTSAFEKRGAIKKVLHKHSSITPSWEFDGKGHAFIFRVIVLLEEDFGWHIFKTSDFFL